MVGYVLIIEKNYKNCIWPEQLGELRFCKYSHFLFKQHLLINAI